MTNCFLTKLARNHRILSAQKPELLLTMQAHPLLTPTFQHSGTVTIYREFCAALLWLDDGPPSVSAVKQLPAAARITLCVMLGLATTPTASDSQSQRIVQYCASKRASPSTGTGSGGAAPGASTGAIAPPTGAAAAGAAGGAQGSGGAGGGATGGPPSGASAAGPGSHGAASGGLGSGQLSGSGASSAAGGRAGALGLQGIISPAQAASVAGLSLAVVRTLVSTAAVPLQATDSDNVARNKLIVAVWSGEVPRLPADVRAFADPVRTELLRALGVADSWAVGVQDGYLRATLDLCRQAPWVLDTSLSHGLLSADRMASLALIASLQPPAADGADTRKQLAKALSDQEFKVLEAALTAAGRTFADVSWAGGSWSVRPPGDAASAAGAGAGGSAASGAASSVAGGSTASTAWGSNLSSISHQGQPAASHLLVLEEQYLTLQLDVFSLLTASENVDFKSRAKFGATGTAGRKRELAHPGAEDRSSTADALPLAQFPWNQVFTLQLSLALSMWGRLLRVALTFWNEHIPDQMTGLVYARLRDDQTSLFNSFQEAVHGNELSQALIKVPEVVRYASVRMMAVQQDAQTRAAQFPSSALFRYVAQQRLTQEQAVATFMDGVTKRITREATSAPTSHRALCSVLMWQEFLGGWMAPSFSPAHCEDLQLRWQRLQQGDPARSGLSHGAAGSASATAQGGSPSTAVGSGGDGGGAGHASNTGGSTPTAGSGARQAQEFRRTIPCSIDVLGNTLGVVQTYKCRTCKPPGRFHHGAECPQRWNKVVGSPMPGFLADGSRDETQWRQKKEPIKSTIRAWIALLSDPIPWNGALPIPAGVSGAPNLDDFQRQLALAPEKP